MAYSKNPPNTIHLAGPCEIVSESDINCGVAATPGMLAEMYDNSGVNAWRPDTNTDIAGHSVFLNSPESNLGIDSVIAIGDTPKVGFYGPGGVFYGIVESGQNISNSEYLTSAGNGRLKTSATKTDLQALDNIGLVAAHTRCRVQVVG